MTRRSIAFLALLLLPASLRAQAVAGRLATATGQPVEAAFVVLEDSTGTRLRSTLSDAGGRYLLRAGSGGRYRLRIERLGLATQTSDMLTLGAGTTVGHDVVLVEKPVVLEGVVVRAEGRTCRTPEQLAADGARLWDEARKALSIAAWASESQRTPMLVERGLREEEHLSRRVVVAEADTIVMEVAGSPWGSAPAAELARLGFIRRQGSDFLYFGADAHLLLEDAFLRTHCFRQV
ncbi:MAG TPA: carboxypeptidase-like regulatory domain-containing protein, partial [Longimicrobiales bacterium]|nr:carboxypeptidase-like regulatory domain-containing protein [Longimicrobiales bacterium]